MSEAEVIGERNTNGHLERYSYYYTCLLIIQYMCPRLNCVVILLYICPHTANYVSSTNVSVLILGLREYSGPLYVKINGSLRLMG